MKSINQTICEYVSAHPLCFTSDVAAHIGRSNENTAKLMNQLETKDYLRCPAKVGRRNQWIVGTNRRFKAQIFSGNKGNGGGVYYPTNGSIGRKRVVTVTTNAADAMAMLAAGLSKLQVA